MMTHGHSKSKTYSTYYAMRARCYNTRNEKYPSYGGAGVTVCARWLESFENFLADMGERPAGMTIDRIGGAKEYNRNSCRWSTPTEQQRNLKNNVNITFQGLTQCLHAWSKELGIANDTLRYRLRRGWTVAKAFTVPPYTGNRIS